MCQQSECSQQWVTHKNHRSIPLLYYLARGAIPRWLQVAARRYWISRRVQRLKDEWPIPRIMRERRFPRIRWPNNRRFSFVIRHDVETAFGVSQCEALMQTDESYGYRASFNFSPERYLVPDGLRNRLRSHGMEIGIHGLKHDGLLYATKRIFERRAKRINDYVEKWGSHGFYSPSSHHHFEWVHKLNILYDSSTFDFDPFEPQNDGIESIFPFVVDANGDNDAGASYVELPYTLPQDFTLFVLMGAQSTEVWKRKIDWIAEKGGMALLVVHPDYLNFSQSGRQKFSYPIDQYRSFLEYVSRQYDGDYWHCLPREMAEFWRTTNPDKSLYG